MSEYDPMDDVAAIELSETKWEEYAKAAASELGLEGRESDLFIAGFIVAGDELYQEFGGIPASSYPPAHDIAPRIAESARRLLG